MAANDNDGYALGLDSEGDTFDRARVRDAQQQILEGLREQLQFGADHLGKLLAKGVAYHNGLTNAEALLGTARALAVYQLEVLERLGGMYLDESDEGDE